MKKYNILLAVILLLIIPQITFTSEAGPCTNSSWNKKISGTGADLMGIFFHDQYTGWVVGIGGLILKTVDGGENWTSQSSGTGQNLYDIYFIDSQTGWAVGGSGSNSGGTILKTSSGGTSWTAQLTGESVTFAGVHFVDSNYGWAVGGPDGIVYSTSNGGSTWSKKVTSATDWLHDVHFWNSTLGWANGGGGQGGLVMKTTNGGSSWSKQRVGSLNAGLHFVDSKKGWMAGDFGSIYRSDNGGSGWYAQSSGQTASFYDIFFPNEDVGWAVGYSGKIVHSSDGGSNWNAQSSGTSDILIGVYFVDERHGWAVGEKGLILKYGCVDTIPPIANAGPDQDVNENTIVSLDGSASTDDIRIENFTWVIDDGNISYLYGEKASYEFTIPGSYDISLNITDEGDNWDVDWVTINIRDSTPPIAVLGARYTADEDTLVIFDGSSSYDNVGITNFSWSFNDDGQQHLFGVSPSYKFENPGLYNITLTVFDAEGHNSSDYTLVTISDVTDPLSIAGEDQLVDEDMWLVLNGTQSSDNVKIVNFTWTFDDGTPQIWNGPLVSYMFTTPGVYNISLSVSDSANNMGVDSLLVTVKDITPPIANPVIPQAIDEDLILLLNGSSSQDNVDILNFTWSFFDKKSQILFGPTPSYIFSNPGVYDINLTVFDETGNYASASSLLTVVDTTAPISNAGPDLSVNEDTLVLLNGSAAGDNIAIESLKWSFNDSISSVNLVGMEPSYTFLNPGTYVVKLNVTDTSGNWNLDDLIITVLDITPPKNHIEVRTTINEDEAAIFDGSLSFDNVAIRFYRWDFDNSDGIQLDDDSPIAYHIYEHPGSYTLTLSTNDSSGNWNTTTMSVTVNDTTSPVGRIIYPPMIYEDMEFILNATMSTDNAGFEGLNYVWDFGSHVELAEETPCKI